MTLPPIILSSSFVTNLLETGTVAVSTYEPRAAVVLEDATHAVLAEWDSTVRLSLGGKAPAYDPSAAAWALVQFHRIAQLLVYREVAAEQVQAAVLSKYPQDVTAAVIHSADLLFQFVPAIYQRASDAAPADPLVAALKSWAGDWPLSSVGIPVDRLPRLGPIADEPALWRLYVDRVAATSSRDRWTDPAVALQLRADLGDFPELAPAMARSLTAISSSSDELHAT